MDPDNDHNISLDIERFTSMKMQELSERIELSDSFCKEIRAALLTNAAGTFLWVGYAMAELLTKNTSLEVREAVENLPTALPASFNRMLRRLPQKKLEVIKKILQWVTLAVRPLSLAELTDAIDWGDQPQAFRDTVAICEPFLTVQRGKVILVHQSAKEYLLQETKDDNVTLENLRITIPEAQSSLAKACLDAVGRYSPLSYYAYSHWPDHVRQCSQHTQMEIVQSDPLFSEISNVVPGGGTTCWWIKDTTRLLTLKFHILSSIGCPWHAILTSKHGYRHFHPQNFLDPRFGLSTTTKTLGNGRRGPYTVPSWEAAQKWYRCCCQMELVQRTQTVIMSVLSGM